MELVGVGVFLAHAYGAFSHRVAGRIVPKPGVVEAEVDGVQAKAVHAAIQPELHIRQYLCLHRRVVEIQVRLAGQEVVQIILPATAVPGPGGTAEHRQPIVGRRAVGFRIGPHVPIGFRVVPAGATFNKPGVLV